MSRPDEIIHYWNEDQFVPTNGFGVNVSVNLNYANDTYDVRYPCGHYVNIASAAAFRAGGVIHVAPPVCPYCNQVKLADGGTTADWYSMGQVPKLSNREWLEQELLRATSVFTDSKSLRQNTRSQ